MNDPTFPPGWDEARIKRVLGHCELQTDEKAVAEDEAAYESTTHTTMKARRRARFADSRAHCKTARGITIAVPWHKYELTVVWSRDDSVFVVDAPELPGCVAHGPTPAEAVKNAQRAIDLWITAARGVGRTVPKPDGSRTLTPEYDFSGGVRGKYFDRYQQGANLVLLEPDIAEAFPDSASVNRALRVLVDIAGARGKQALKAGRATRKRRIPHR
jgi:predicted RNase H-like HicB family nuclease